MPTITLFEASRALDRLADAIDQIDLNPTTQLSLFSTRAEQEISRAVDRLKRNIVQFGEYFTLQAELRTCIVTISLNTGLTALLITKQKLQEKIQRLKLLSDTCSDVLQPDAIERFMTSARLKFEAGNTHNCDVVLSVTNQSFYASLQTLLKLVERELISIEKEIEDLLASTDIDTAIVFELQRLGFA